MNILESTNLQTPLIDREIFFKNPSYTKGCISPNGNYFSFLKEYNGAMNIWIKETDDDIEKAFPISNHQNNISYYYWSEDSQHIVFALDDDGNENYKLFAISISNIQNKTMSEILPITNFTNSTIRIFLRSKLTPNIFYIGVNNRDPKWFDLLKIDITTGDFTLIQENHNEILSWIFDWEEVPRLISKMNNEGCTELHKINIDMSFTPVYVSNFNDFISPLKFNEDNSKIYITTNKDRNFKEVVMLDLESLEISHYDSDPLQMVDIYSIVFSENNRIPLYTSYIDEKIKYYFKEAVFGKIFESLLSHFKGKNIVFKLNNDDSIISLTMNSDIVLEEMYTYNIKTQKLTFQYNSRPELKSEWLCPMEPFSFISIDGLKINAYLTRPKSSQKEKLPMVVNPHGGPWTRNFWHFSKEVQFLANRGYAVLQINFRGSDGYGKAFIDAGNKQWGAKMQDDITYGVQHLVNSGLADPKRIAIYGGSYGGYSTLAGLCFTPNLYACGIDYCGVSNLNTFLSLIPQYWEFGKKMLYNRVGNPHTEKEFLDSISPCYFANNIIAPTMIVQGANDPRVLKIESDQMAVSLSKKVRDVKYYCAHDEGHGFNKEINNLTLYYLIEQFLALHLKGRAQTFANNNILENVRKLTVDISSLNIPKSSN